MLRLNCRPTLSLPENRILAWRIRAHPDRIAQHYKTPAELDLDALADMLSAVTDGGIVLSKAMGQAELLGRQIRTRRILVRTAFLGR